MKTLYIMRHAKSSWKDMSLDDFDRPLNGRGKENAPFMGMKLKNKGVLPDIIISSPALRAKKTAIKIAKELGYDKKKINFISEMYESSTSDIISIIKKQNNNYDSIMIFGHNPTFTSLANLLSDYEIFNIPTSGVVGIHFKIDNWDKIDSKKGKMLFFDYPKRFAEEI